MFIIEYLFSLSLSQLVLHIAGALFVVLIIGLLMPSGGQKSKEQDNKAQSKTRRPAANKANKKASEPQKEASKGFFSNLFSKKPHDPSFDFLNNKSDQALTGFTHPNATDHASELVKATPDSAAKGPDTSELNALFTTMIKAGAIEHKNFLVTNFEHHYLEKLRIWFGYKYEIYCQVSVGSVVNINPMVDLPKTASEKIDRKQRLLFAQKCHNMCFDFLLIEKGTDRIVCAIELDDPTHLSEDRKQRDRRLDKICIAAKLPIFHITNIYQKPDIRRL